MLIIVATKKGWVRMSLLEKLYSFIILLSVVLGLGLGNFMTAANYAELFIVPLLIGMQTWLQWRDLKR